MPLFFAIYMTGTATDTFDSFAIEDVGVVAMAEIFLFFSGCNDELSECFKLTRKGEGNPTLGSTSDIDAEIDIVDFASIWSESMPK
jgi:hypothetical protein